MDDGQSGDATESGFALFDRWLAHREPKPDERPEPPEPDPTPVEEAPAPAVEEPEVADSPVAEGGSDQEPAAVEQSPGPGSGETEEPAVAVAPLFDRWLAHREPAAEPEPSEPVPTAVDEPPAPAIEEPAARVEEPPAPGPAIQEPEVAALDPLFDESFPLDESEPTTHEPDIEIPELPRRVPETAPEETEPDPAPPTLDTFEPVIIPSARHRQQGSRRPRRGERARRAEPETPASPTEQPMLPTTQERLDESPPEPAEAPPVTSAPLPPPESPSAANVAAEETVEVAGADEDAPAADLARTPEVAAVEEVATVAEVDEADEVHGVDEVAEDPALRPRAPRRGWRRPVRPGPRTTPVQPEPDVAQALLGTTAVEPRARLDPASSRPVDRAPTPALPVEAERAPSSRPGYAAPAPPGESTNATFAPRTGTRRLVGVLLLVALTGTAVAAYRAYVDSTDVNVGLAAILGTLTLVIWAVRAGTAPVRMSVTAGQLEVVGSEGRFVFDLMSRYTPIEVVGEPGRRGWKVLFLRRGMSPFVVDASMVDPDEFMRVLRRHRPDS